MKIFFALMVLGNFSFAASEKECSSENLKKLVIESMKATGLYIQLNLNHIKVVRKSNEKTKISELQKEFYSVGPKITKQIEPHLTEMEKIVKANPECNIEGLFTGKNKQGE